MMLVVGNAKGAAEDQQRQEKQQRLKREEMLSSDDELTLRSGGREGSLEDTVAPKRKSNARKRSKSPLRSIKDVQSASSEATNQIEGTATTKVRPKAGEPTRTRSITSGADQLNQDRKSRNGKPSSTENCETSKTSSSSREGKSKSRCSGGGTSRRGNSLRQPSHDRQSKEVKDVESKPKSRQRRRRMSAPFISEKAMENISSSTCATTETNISGYSTDTNDKEGEHDTRPSEMMPLTSQATEVSSKDSLRKHNNTTSESKLSSQRHRSKSRSRSSGKATMGYIEDSAVGDKGTGKEKSKERGNAGGAKGSVRSERLLKPEESTLDSSKNDASEHSQSEDFTNEPTLSTRSSVKVASALVKFRMVLAKSKEASMSAQKYHDEQEKQAHNMGMDDVVTIKTSTLQKEKLKSNVKSNSEPVQPKQETNRQKGETTKQRKDASQHRSEQDQHKRDVNQQKGEKNQHRRDASASEDMDNMSCHKRDNSQHKNDASHHRPDDSKSKGSKNFAAIVQKSIGIGLGKPSWATKKIGGDTDAMLNMLGHVAMNVTRPGAEKKSVGTISQAKTTENMDSAMLNILGQAGKKCMRPGDEKKSTSIISQAKEEAKTTSNKDSNPPNRLKSSAKVSTAMLKFQQALALSKSATQAAKTQQDTQNKLLGQVHGEKTLSTEDLLRWSKRAAALANASPVSAVDVVEISEAKESPIVPTNLDDDSGDSDIDSEIEIDDLSDGEELSYVDSESDIESDMEDTTATIDNKKSGLSKISNPAAVVIVASMESDDSDIEDCSSVNIDSDDDLDSDGEIDNEGVIADDSILSVVDSTEKAGDDTRDATTEESTSMTALAALRTPEQASWNEKAAAALLGGLEDESKDSKVAPPEPTGERGKLEEISRRLLMVRRLSYTNQTTNVPQQQSRLDTASTEEKGDVSSLNGQPNLTIPGLSPAVNNKGSLMREDSQPMLSYLPASMKKSDHSGLPAALIHDHSEGNYAVSYASDSETNKRSRNALARKSSNTPFRRSKSNASSVDSSSDSSTNSRTRTRSISRARKAPSRSHSSSSEEEMPQEYKRGSSLDKRETKSKSAERSVKRAASASMNRIVNGLGLLSDQADQKMSAAFKRRKGDSKRPSSRRKLPSRAKSHDGSRFSTSAGNDKEAKDRRRKASSIVALSR